MIYHRILNIALRSIPVGPCCLSILIAHSCQSQSPNPSFPQPTPPWQPQVCSLCLTVCCIFRFICVILYIPHMSNIMWYFSFSFWLTSLSMIISSCIHVAANGIFPSFLWLSSIPLYICTTSLSIHLLMDIKVVSMSWLLWTVLLWTLRCMYLFALEFCRDIGPGVGLLNYMVILLLTFWGASILFSTVAAPNYSYTKM